MAESNWKSDGYVPDKHGFWKATLDDRADFGYPVGYYTGEYSTSLEPSCQFEISINPYSDLEKIKGIYNEFRTLWEPVFSARGYHSAFTEIPL